MLSFHRRARSPPLIPEPVQVFFFGGGGGVCNAVVRMIICVDVCICVFVLGLHPVPAMPINWQPASAALPRDIGVGALIPQQDHPVLCWQLLCEPPLVCGRMHMLTRAVCAARSTCLLVACLLPLWFRSTPPSFVCFPCRTG